MVRSIERTKRFPPFRCDAAEIERFTQEIFAEFKDGDPRLSINVVLPGEELTFSVWDELRQAEGLPALVTEWSLSIHDQKQSRRCSISSRYDNYAHVHATSTSEAWCAGLVEIVRSFAHQHRRWYWPIRFGVMLAAMSIAGGTFGAWVASRSPAPITAAPAITWLLCGLILFFSIVSYRRIFPPAQIIIRTPKN